MSTPAVRSLRKTGYDAINLPAKDALQQQLFSQVGGAAGPGITSGVNRLSQLAAGSPEMFQQLEAPALRQFQELAGSLGARFSGLGTGAQRSSAFQNALTGAAGDLSERLQGQRMGLQQSAIEQLMGLYQNLIGTDMFHTGLVPKKKPWWQELLMSGAEGIGKGIGQAGTFALLG